MGSTTSGKRIGTGRAIVFMACGLFLAVAAGECVARIVHYGLHGERTLALGEFLANARDKVVDGVSRKSHPMPVPHEREHNAAKLYEPVGAALLAEFQRDYTTAFDALRAEVAATGADFRVFYIASPPGREGMTAATRVFFRELCDERDVPFLDADDAFEGHTREHVYLMPHDEHLARLGNQLLAARLTPWIEAALPDTPPQGDTSFEAFPRLGDYKPNSKASDGRGWSLYDSKINGQGLRRPHDVMHPKRTHHVLLLGDSFTYGVYLPFEYTYGHLVEKQLRGVSVLNAGVCGYTILDQLALFRERARHARADVVVLQVYDNDLADMFSYMRNAQARDRKTVDYAPRALEVEFTAALRAARPR